MSPPTLQLGSAATLTRRQAFLALLAGAAAVVLPAGCTSKSAPPPVDDNRVLLESAYQVEASLLTALAADDAPPRSPLRSQAEQIVQEHLDRLAAVLGGAVAANASPSNESSGDFAAAARQAADMHMADVREASPEASQLLSSLAASDLVLSKAFQGSGSEPPS